MGYRMCPQLDRIPILFGPGQSLCDRLDCELFKSASSAVGVGATDVGGIGVGGAGVAVGVAVNVGLGAGSPPQATDTNRTTDKPSSGMWSFTISSLVQGGSAIPSLNTALIQAGPCSTASAGPRCSLPTTLPCGPGVSNQRNRGLCLGKKADPRVSLLPITRLRMLFSSSPKPRVARLPLSVRAHPLPSRCPTARDLGSGHYHTVTGR